MGRLKSSSDEYFTEWILTVEQFAICAVILTVYTDNNKIIFVQTKKRKSIEMNKTGAKKNETKNETFGVSSFSRKGESQ